MMASCKEWHLHATVVGFLLFFQATLTLTSAAKSSIITTLPGFDGVLPFTLETGYVGVGDNETAKLFYYFVESQRNPAEDPVVLWIDGGPGCSSAIGFFFESGPLQFKYSDYNGSLPSLHLNPYTWSKALNMIYLDAPVGTGFSYSTTDDGPMNDYIHVAQAYEFIQKWLVAHPQYLKNQLYIGGDSYSGIPVPMIVKSIIDGNAAGNPPVLNLKGYILGNPVTDSFIDDNTRIPFAHRLTLVSDSLYEAAKSSCNGDFVNIDPSNLACVTNVDAINELTRHILTAQVLEPNCVISLPDSDNVTEVQKFLKEKSEGHGYTASPAGVGPHPWCRNYNHVLCVVWANNKGVQEALNIRPGTKASWQFCNRTLTYDKVLTSVVDYHMNLTKTNLRAIIYSGDHDMSIPHIGTQHWINLLNLTLNESWRAWSVDGQTAGYTKNYIKGSNFSLTFATLKGAGHMAAEYKVKEASAMIERWTAYYPL